MRFIDKGLLQECKECDGDCGECELIADRFDIQADTPTEEEFLVDFLKK